VTQEHTFGTPRYEATQHTKYAKRQHLCFHPDWPTISSIKRLHTNAFGFNTNRISSNNNKL